MISADFRMLIFFYPETLLNFFFNSNRFVLWSLRGFLYI